MFSRLVTGRFARNSEDQVYANTVASRPGWLSRLISNIFARKR